MGMKEALPCLALLYYKILDSPLHDDVSQLSVGLNYTVHGPGQSLLKVGVKFFTAARYTVQKHSTVHETQSFAVHQKPVGVDVVGHVELQRHLPEPTVNVATSPRPRI